MMTKTLILFLTLGIAAAGVVQVDNALLIGRTLKSQNFTDIEDIEIEQAAKGFGFFLAETSGQACNQGSGRAQQRCNELARRVFGNEFVSSSTVTMYHNMVDECTFRGASLASLGAGLVKTILGEAIVWTKAGLHCKVCQSSSWCHQKVKTASKTAECINRVLHDGVQAIVSSESLRGGSLGAIASWAGSLLYTAIFKVLPACSAEDVTEIVNSYNTKFGKKINFTHWELIRLIASVAIGAITSKISAHVANAVAAFAVPGFGTAWSAAKFGWELYSLAKNCKWDVQAAIKSLIKAGVSLYQAATGVQNTGCASSIKSALLDTLDTMLCWFKQASNIYKRMGCSSRMIRQFA